VDHGQCLTEETFTDYLEGALDPAVKAASEVHLLACDDCRSRLGFFIRLLDREVSPDESEKVQTVISAWEKKRARQGVPSRTGTLGMGFIMWAAIAALLVVGVISIPFMLQRLAEPKSANEVVQLLLSRDRPFESRLADQPYRSSERTRGADNPGVSYGLLAGEMTRLSASSYQMGRFYLLQKDFDRAIDYLEIGERETGVGAEVHNDLGVAYLESGGELRLRKATQEFEHALEADPQFAAAVFNLAVFYERTGANSQAEAEWKRYLQLDRNSGWAGEAQTRLQGLNR
jgi:tetratricopeptide (TPR) repeat protein